MFQALLGWIRVPKKCRLDLDGSNNDLSVTFVAEHFDGSKVNFAKTYPGLLLPVALVTDLKEWLSYTAKTFYGSERGGL